MKHFFKNLFVIFWFFKVISKSWSLVFFIESWIERCLNESESKRYSSHTSLGNMSNDERKQDRLYLHWILCLHVAFKPQKMSFSQRTNDKCMFVPHFCHFAVIT